MANTDHSDNTRGTGAVAGAQEAADLGLAVDRRRPGRMAEVSPELLPLLRKPIPDGEAAAALLAEATILPPLDGPADRPADAGQDLNPVRGILAAVALSLPLWLVIVLAASFLF